jgi:hypothetical protein
LSRRDEDKPGAVLKEAKRPGEALPIEWDWVEHSIWTERMLEALAKGVKGGTWFSLIDKEVLAEDMIISAGLINSFGTMGFSAL